MVKVITRGFVNVATVFILSAIWPLYIGLETEKSNTSCSTCLDLGSTRRKKNKSFDTNSNHHFHRNQDDSRLHIPNIESSQKLGPFTLSDQVTIVTMALYATRF